MNLQFRIITMIDKLKGYLEFLNSSSFVGIEEKILNLFKSLPKTPANINDFLVTVAPYLSLLGGVLNFLSVVSLLALSNTLLYTTSIFYNPMMAFSPLYIISNILTGILLVAAFGDLKNKKVFGWRLLFWSANISILTSLVGFDFISTILGGFVSWYILAQVRSSYS